VNVAFRVDASAAVGVGHFMRCHRLAVALLRLGASVKFVMRQATFGSLESLAAAGIDVALDRAGTAGPDVDDDAAWTRGAIGDIKWNWLVVDHYNLDHRWESAVAAHADRVMVIDDVADRAHVCDLLVDVNAYQEPERRYVGLVPESCALLLGPKYALIDDEFAKRHRQSRVRTGPVTRVYVGFGGGDQDDYTGRAVEGLAALTGQSWDVDVVVGGAYPYRDRLVERCRALGFALHVQPPSMASIMAAADLAIGGGGSMTWERSCVGVPTLAFVMAENQRLVVTDGAALGLLYAPDASSDVIDTVTRHVRCLAENEALRTRLSRTALNLVDGLGVSRVVRAMSAPRVGIRAAQNSDARFVFDCRNHPAVRAVSRNDAEISWADHQRWFAAALQHPNRHVFIGEIDGRPIGSVRFDVSDATAEVSISVHPSQHGAGIGRALLAGAELAVSRTRPELRELSAAVLDGNRPSMALFEGAGYSMAQRIYTKPVGKAEG
jgi:UDP-2,4-diacetamido-2,4,6-trideoxy-beta-L-altropyranose hydrolase